MILQPKLSPVPGRDQYCLTEDYPVKFDGIKILVPAFFIFDGASIPYLLQSVIYSAFHPRVMAPALVHDWLYLNHQVDRETADRILYELLLQNGANGIKALLMLQGVRMFGGLAWENNERDRAKIATLYCLAVQSPRFGEYHFPVSREAT